MQYYKVINALLCFYILYKCHTMRLRCLRETRHRQSKIWAIRLEAPKGIIPESKPEPIKTWALR